MIMDMCEYKELIESEIISNYSSPADVDGHDLHELGEWIDIIKDIAEMKYYHSEYEKNEKIIESMGGNTVESTVQGLINLVEDNIKNMTASEKDSYKKQLEILIDMM